MHIAIVSGVICFFLGILFAAIPSKADLDIEAENKKLRQENEFLWKRIQKGHNRDIEDKP